MIIDELGFYSLDDVSFIPNDDFIRIRSDEILQNIIKTYGYKADVYCIFPPDNGRLRSVMLDFRSHTLADGSSTRFLNITLTPAEIHIIKKQFDELFAF